MLSSNNAKIVTGSFLLAAANLHGCEPVEQSGLSKVAEGGETEQESKTTHDVVTPTPKAAKKNVDKPRHTKSKKRTSDKVSTKPESNEKSSPKDVVAVSEPKQSIVARVKDLLDNNKKACIAVFVVIVIVIVGVIIAVVVNGDDDTCRSLGDENSDSCPDTHVWSNKNSVLQEGVDIKKECCVEVDSCNIVLDSYGFNDPCPVNNKWDGEAKFVKPVKGTNKDAISGKDSKCCKAVTKCSTETEKNCSAIANTYWNTKDSSTIFASNASNKCCKAKPTDYKESITTDTTCATFQEEFNFRTPTCTTGKEWKGNFELGKMTKKPTSFDAAISACCQNS